jgi:hypothetical protein
LRNIGEFKDMDIYFVNQIIDVVCDDGFENKVHEGLEKIIEINKSMREE